MVQTLLEGQSEHGLDVLHAQDVMNMTPLHTAALFDHDDIAAYLIEQVGEQFIITTQLFNTGHYPRREYYNTR